ncbi:hypothetical protein HYT57_01530 [Candidatus Woesearchaeota archaeon]|nr:hypothetical protein [Candidatus Woesearchaeota archaeon]
MLDKNEVKDFWQLILEGKNEQAKREAEKVGIALVIENFERLSLYPNYIFPCLIDDDEEWAVADNIQFNSMPSWFDDQKAIIGYEVRGNVKIISGEGYSYYKYKNRFSVLKNIRKIPKDLLDEEAKRNLINQLNSPENREITYRYSFGSIDLAKLLKRGGI